MAEQVVAGRPADRQIVHGHTLEGRLASSAGRGAGDDGEGRAVRVDESGQAADAVHVLGGEPDGGAEPFGGDEGGVDVGHLEGGEPVRGDADGGVLGRDRADPAVRVRRPPPGGVSTV